MISVIVPVYNVEKYLDKCVKSILAQTYTDFELILVDDGASDHCPAMCDAYADSDCRVRVVHKQNGGLSDARNAGTEAAKGEYVTYIDSDDYVADDYLETLISLITKYDADIAVTGIEIVFEGQAHPVQKAADEFFYTGEEALKKMLYQDTLDTSACAILLPYQVAKEYPFPYRKYHEDEFTTYKYYSAVNRVAVTTKAQYFYVQRKGSIMHVFGQQSLDELDAADNLVDYCLNHYPSIVPAAESKKFSDYCQVLLSNKNIKTESRDSYKRIYQYLSEKKTQILLDPNCRRKNRIAALLLFFGTGLLYAASDITQRV